MTDRTKRGVLGWLWQGATVAESRKRIDAKSERRKELEAFAATAAETGDRALRPVTPLRFGPGEAVSASLHSQSIRATLRALDSSAQGLRDNEGLRGRIEEAVSGAISFERLVELLVPPPGVDADEAWMQVTPNEAQALASAARALLDEARASERQLHDALLRRVVRTTSFAFVVAVVAIVVVVGGTRVLSGPNLAEGKPWRASSTYRGFSPADGMCDKRKTAIFFHTNREQDPWVEIDLGQPTSIHRVDIRNRRDCCRDRTFPLTIEVSTDGTQWTEVGTQTEPFSRWTLEFAPIPARYVRARARKRTFLHLEGFEVR